MLFHFFLSILHLFNVHSLNSSYPNLQIPKDNFSCFQIIQSKYESFNVITFYYNTFSFTSEEEQEENTQKLKTKKKLSSRNHIYFEYITHCQLSRSKNLLSPIELFSRIPLFILHKFFRI